MGISEEKQKKLAYVARRYYLDDWKQSDIAKELGVSRPLVSRMPAEAREHGVVDRQQAELLERAAQIVRLNQGMAEALSPPSSSATASPVSTCAASTTSPAICSPTRSWGTVFPRRMWTTSPWPPSCTTRARSPSPTPS